jgi:gamma-glutamyl-gamma-aminobutyrate hydrolase PuuD
MIIRPRVGLTQRVVVVPSGERRDSLDQRWPALLVRLGARPVPIPNVPESTNVIGDLGLSGLILTGGNDLADVESAMDTAPERDALESALLTEAVGQSIPVLGVCRGMQMIVRHHGGKIVRVPGHAGTVHGVRPVAGPNALAPQDTVVRSYHNFGVVSDGLAGGLSAVALASDGTIEAVMHPTVAQWGIMWHPEREGTQGEALLDRVFHFNDR